MIGVLIIIAIPLFGLYLSNVALDRGLHFALARKVGHLMGGIPYFLGPLLFESSWPIVIVSAGFTVLLATAHLLKKDLFRGVGGVSRPGSIAEVTYPLAGTISLLVGWTWLGNPWLGVVPVLFVSAGDGISGIARYSLHKNEPLSFCRFKSIDGTIVFIAVCLLIALLFKPYWVAAIGVFISSIAEGIFGERAWIKIDDNLPIQMSALVVMSLLT